ncbi:MAG: hypothetical protein EZS28_048847 [Streblomastix strix]|uniref:Uncharacterized protein n=1 Tax=Streblomastix strix TaxID=222440 RepID=A0A5J4TB57_9EUKA|nr:MAG: hypothetical protein EZS28_048847 [Streblomastix strix]
MRDEVQSPIVQTIVRRLNLEQLNKVKYLTVWNINQLLAHVAQSDMDYGILSMRKAIVFPVEFSGTRMAELAYYNYKREKAENKINNDENKRKVMLSSDSNERVITGQSVLIRNVEEDLAEQRQNERVGKYWIQKQAQVNFGLGRGGWVLCRLHCEILDDDKIERGWSFAGGDE